MLVGTHDACLAHLDIVAIHDYVNTLRPGSSVDFRGTTLDARLLNLICNKMRDPATGRVLFGEADFDGAIFEEQAIFAHAVFRGKAYFAEASFERYVTFFNSVFERRVVFREATFPEGVSFVGAKFVDDVEFTQATFAVGVDFSRAYFQRTAVFHEVTFEGQAPFGDTLFRDVVFTRAIFERADQLGPIMAKEGVDLSGATFGAPVTLMISTPRLECRRTRWSATAELRLRYAAVDFSSTVFEYPMTIATEMQPFTAPRQPVRLAHAEGVLGRTQPSITVSITSLRGVDAAHLVLADVDLSRCLFTGAVHLDQVRMEGTCTFDTVPSGTHWRRWRPVRYAPRRALAEEHHWRASSRRAVRGWNVGVLNAAHVGPQHLTPVYRALRKSFEDSKNEPGAADFYYAEMEMRRKDKGHSARGERALLHMYWAMSGYGLRAVRALGWLVVSMVLTVLLMMQWGLPQGDTKQEATGLVPPGGGKVAFEIVKSDPVNPTGDRFSAKRLEKALRVTLNSVVFRSSGEELTTSGTYIEMTSRVIEPVLLGMAVLAIRNRVKR